MNNSGLNLKRRLTLLRVETFVQLPNIKTEHDVRFIRLNNFNFEKYGSELLYCYFEILDENSNVVFQSSIERCPEYYLVILQLIKQTLQDGQGEWEFPSLLKFEALDAEKIRITQNEEIYVFPLRPLFNALLDECKFLMDALVPYIDYPSEGVALYYKDMDDLLTP